MAYDVHRKRLMRKLFHTLLFAATLSGASFAATPHPEALSTAKAKWNEWDSLVTSLEVEGYKFAGTLMSPANVFSTDDLKELVFSRVVPLLGDTDDDLSLESLTRLTGTVFRERVSPNNPKHPVGSWRSYSLVDDKGKMRLEVVIGGNPTMTIRVGNEEQQYLSAMKQVDYRSDHSGYKVEDRAFFLYRPAPLDESADISLSHVRNTVFRGKSDRLLVEFDSDTGFVSRHSVFDASSKPILTRIQAIPVILPSTDTPVARVIAVAHFFQQTGHIRGIELFVINKVFANRFIDPSQFVMSVPAGTTVVDHSTVDEGRTLRDGQLRPLVRETQTPVADVTTHIKSDAFRAVRQPSVAFGPSKWGITVFICINAIIFGIAVWFIYKRRMSVR